MAFDREPWVSYEVKTMADALSIMRAFGELDFLSARESGCLSIGRADGHGKDYANAKERWEIPQGVELRQRGGRGFYTAELVFYPLTPRVKVSVKIEQFPYQFRAHMDANYSRHGEVSSAKLNEPNALLGMYTERVKFNGGLPDAFDLRYYFSGPDHVADLINILPQKVTA
jgi:hypothetical protein